TQQLPGACDVRLTNLRVVDRKGLEDDLARCARRFDDFLRELDKGVLDWIPDVHGQMLAAPRESHEPADEVVRVATAARLRAVAEHGERLVRERLPQERRNRTPVVRSHAGS